MVALVTLSYWCLAVVKAVMNSSVAVIVNVDLWFSILFMVIFVISIFSLTLFNSLPPCRSDDDERGSEGRRGAEPGDAPGVERDGGRDSYGPDLRISFCFKMPQRSAGGAVLGYRSCACVRTCVCILISILLMQNVHTCSVYLIASGRCNAPLI